MKILLADDEPILIKNIITMGGHQVDVAYDGLEAVYCLNKCKYYDLVILDLAMPNMDGWETLKHIRKNPEFKKLYIIMLTANNQEESAIKGLDQGADEYLVKPISPRRLLAHLQALERRILDDQNKTCQQLLDVRFGSLTHRENELLHLVSLGHSNTQIAHELCISEITVKNHLHKIYRKLGVKSRTQAICLTRNKEAGTS